MDSALVVIIGDTLHYYMIYKLHHDCRVTIAKMHETFVYDQYCLAIYTSIQIFYYDDILIGLKLEDASYQSMANDLTEQNSPDRTKFDFPFLDIALDAYVERNEQCQIDGTRLCWYAFTSSCEGSGSNALSN